MINKLHLAMIELYRGDAKRIQHFCKVHSYAKLIGEHLQKADQMAWVRATNQHRAIAEEIILKELIYV